MGLLVERESLTLYFRKEWGLEGAVERKTCYFLVLVYSLLICQGNKNR